tara:strand:+ start:1165 stop:1344 length:180 start_codon:yes stop_codon:yes gene_type:complete
MTKRNKLMFLKNKALAVFRFGYKEDPEITFYRKWVEFELNDESMDWAKDVPKDTKGEQK